MQRFNIFLYFLIYVLFKSDNLYTGEDECYWHVLCMDTQAKILLIVDSMDIINSTSYIYHLTCCLNPKQNVLCFFDIFITRLQNIQKVYSSYSCRFQKHFEDSLFFQYCQFQILEGVQYFLNFCKFFYIFYFIFYLVR